MFIQTGYHVSNVYNYAGSKEDTEVLIKKGKHVQQRASGTQCLVIRNKVKSVVLIFILHVYIYIYIVP